MGPSYDDLIAQLADDLEAHGWLRVPLADLPVKPTVWRRAARAAARRMGRTVKTGESADGVHAWLTDWPRDEREQQTDQRRASPPGGFGPAPRTTRGRLRG